MLAVAALIKALGNTVPDVATTVYIYDDPVANSLEIAHQINTPIWYVNPDFGELGHKGFARYCIGEVKEGMGAGGAMMLAYLLGKSPDEIKNAILMQANAYTA
jgi:NaMN:DMB phosphoribosyltransferase